MSKRVSSKITASFIEPMLCLSTSSLPEVEGWEYELKPDGYRAVAVKAGGRTVQLRSRNDKDFSARFPLIVMALAALPSDTVIDGELVAFDESGRPSFNALQNYASAQRIFYYVFDLLILEGRDLSREATR